MSEVDRPDAMTRLKRLFAESKANNEGAGIPEIVETILGDDADEEIIELVLIAMEDSGPISSEEILDGILKLHEWRLEQT
jgi:hypothetical protein|tara:strand:+ start:1809 stop:2048 length:240 start_codon:yes stop_codon:yes gene_type:complete